MSEVVGVQSVGTPSGAAGDAAAAGPIFRARNVIALVLVGVFAFSAFVTLLAYAPDLERDTRCRANVYSKCAVGFAGLAALLKNDGAPLVISRAAPLPKGRSEGLFIVTPEPGQESDVAKLGFGGPTLVVLPKWDAAVDRSHLSWGLKAGLVNPAEMPRKGALDAVRVARAQGVARARLVGAAGTPFEGVTLTPGPIDSLQTFSAQGWTPVLTDATGAAVIAQAPGSQLYVLSEPDLLNTQGLASLDTLGAAVGIVRALRTADGPVIFDVTLNGYQTERNPLRLMFDPPFLAVTLCFAAALALAGLQAAFRFGPVRRAPRAFALGKEALTDNSAQLIRLAGREGHMAPAYAALSQKAAARAVGAPRELTGEALTGFLDRLSAQRGLPDTLSALNAEAARAHDSALGRAGLTALAGRIYRWRLEMTRERQ
ncbi:MAG TPA: hypothetical protein VN694_02610 [Caulobacteraceae bacterium]|nr:hypothetical protein [Caulobacteraceae bacterium]